MHAQIYVHIPPPQCPSLIWFYEVNSFLLIIIPKFLPAALTWDLFREQCQKSAEAGLISTPKGPRTPRWGPRGEGAGLITGPALSFSPFQRARVIRRVKFRFPELEVERPKRETKAWGSSIHISLRVCACVWMWEWVHKSVCACCEEMSRVYC